MHELDDDGAFADAGGDAFYRAVANIADDKDAWDIGFQQAGIAVESPRCRPLAVAHQVRPGEDEAALVAIDNVAEPLGTRLCADENKKTRGWELLACTAWLALHGDSCEARISLHFDDAGLRPKFDVRGFFNLLDEV